MAIMNFESSCDTSNSLTIISIFNIISDFLENIQIEIDNNGFHIFGFDGCQILYIDVNLNKTFFKDFHIEKQILLCFKVEQINSFFKNINKSSIESILMGYDEDVMFIRVIKSNGTISNFKVPEVCVDIKEKYEISENIEYQCEVLMPSNLLSDICNELKPYKDLNLKIQVNKNNLFFKIDDSIINADIVLENKKTREFYLICKKNFSIEFKNKYFLKINNIVKKINIEECFLQMNEKCPLIIIFSICSVSSFQFYLAPILE
ncbi:hypothetical protein ACTFIW_004217 [Dictyostelium discoideum]